MMHLKFPLPTGYFPKFELSPDETLAYKELVTDLVKEARREHDAFVSSQQRHVDARKWKLAKAKDKLHIYKRRSEYGAAAIGLTGRRHDLVNVSDRSESESSGYSQSAGSSTAAGFASPARLGAHHRSAASRSRVGSHSSSRSGGGDNEQQPHRRRLEPTLLATGLIDGSVDDLVWAFHEPTASETKAAEALLGGDALVDAVVLHTIKSSRTTYLGLKWKLCRTPGGNRDMCFLEYVGVANDARGQRYGFKVVESVQLRNCPPFADNSIIRTELSFVYLFRESAAPGVVDVYLQGAFDSSGDAVTAGGVGDARSTMDMLLEIETRMEIAEAKKLAELVARQAAATPKPKGSNVCSICRAKPGMLSSHLQCQGCGGVICNKCKMKKVIVTTKRGQVHKVKIACCKICLVNVKETSPFEGEPINAQPPQLRALTKKPSASSLRGDEPHQPRQAAGLESTQELALALPHTHTHGLKGKQLATGDSFADTEFSGSLESWQSSSVSSSYSDLDDSYGSPSNQLVVAHKMPALAESPRSRGPHQPQYAYSSLANGTMVATSGAYHRAPPPPLPPQRGAPQDLNQHRLGLYNQMLELQVQAERAYNLANQNATYMHQQHS